MSIKPVDFNVMLPKTQEISISKHNENVKNQNIVQSEFINQDKKILNQKSRVRNKEKVDSTKIKRDKEFKKEKNHQEDNKENSTDIEDKVKKTRKKNLGINIDIRI